MDNIDLVIVQCWGPSLVDCHRAVLLTPAGSNKFSINKFLQNSCITSTFDNFSNSTFEATFILLNCGKRKRIQKQADNRQTQIEKVERERRGREVRERSARKKNEE